MTLIHVPKPPQSAMDPNRPVSALLKTQIEHLQEAEKRLPSRYRSEIYVNAIKTEGEAAEYIRAVTEAIHSAHADAEARRTRRKRGLEIAAAAAPQTRRTRSKAKRRDNSSTDPKD